MLLTCAKALEEVCQQNRYLQQSRYGFQASGTRMKTLSKASRAHQARSGTHEVFKRRGSGDAHVLEKFQRLSSD
jgi:hypothetical protein